MVFSSSVFLLLFFPIMILGYFFPVLSRKRTYRNGFLLLGSLFFYAWGEPSFVLLMMFSIFVTWFIGILFLYHKQKRVLLTVGIAYHLIILIVFKYTTFLSHELWYIFPQTSLDKVNIPLPIGISFYTFQMMSYLFDVYYERVCPQKSLLNLGLYVSFFPQLIAGPIVRYTTIEDEIENRCESFDDLKVGLERFILGLGKKALIADFLAIIANESFAYAKSNDIGMLTSWMGAIAYTLEIYYDFSGYSDMAIGLGRCFGFHFMENFDYPYMAKSINDFWKRWHISLTGWFRDYVYIPLGGNRVTKRRHIINALIIWSLTGIWHGANWTFLIWGMMYCALQMGERYLYTPDKWPTFISHIYTMFFVCLLWVVFRADSVKTALLYIKAMILPNRIWDGISIVLFRNGITILIIGVICCAPLKNIFIRNIENSTIGAFREIIKYSILIGILLMTLACSISGGYSPFIYYNF